MTHKLVGRLTSGEVAEQYLVVPARRLGRRLPTIRYLALYLLIAYVVVQLVFLGLAELAARTIHLYTSPLEVECALALHQYNIPALTLLFLSLAILGSGPVNVLLTAAFGWLLVQRRSPILGASLALMMVGAWWLEALTKLLVQRARPELFRLASASGYGFPSGHALLAACLYGTLAFASWRRARRRWQRAGLAVGAVALPLGIGLSRVYLGVHYPTDVLGGWAAGLLWLAAARLALRAFIRRRRRAPGSS